MANNKDLEIRRSPADSLAFGLNIGRVELSQEYQSRFNSLSFSGYDCVIIDLVGAIPDLQIVQSHRELRYAGSLIYWHGDEKWLSNKRCNLPAQSSQLVVANETNLGKFLDVCLDAFEEYVSHYSYSPIFNTKPVNESYADWIAQSLNKQNYSIYGYEIDGSLASFALCESKENSIEILLAGTARNFRQSGAYTSLIDSVARATPLEISEFYISTQVTNIGVQKLWAKFGLVPLRAITRYHLWLN